MNMPLLEVAFTGEGCTTLKAQVAVLVKLEVSVHVVVVIVDSAVLVVFVVL
jgi:hypothetical protein